MAISTNTSSGAGTGYNTANPQNIGQNTSISGGTANPQNLVGSTSINNQSSGQTIPLQPGSLTTAPLQPTKTSHHTSGLAFIPIALIVILAAALIIRMQLAAKNKKLANS